MAKETNPGRDEPDDMNTDASAPSTRAVPKAKKPAPEIGGRGGPDPSRYGDWEINGRCVDF